MATNPVGIPGVPGQAIADPASGEVQPAWRSFFVMLSRLSSATNAMLGVSAASVPNNPPALPPLTTAANDAAAAAAGVPLFGLYWTGTAVVQRRV